MHQLGGKTAMVEAEPHRCGQSDTWCDASETRTAGDGEVEVSGKWKKVSSG